MITLKNLVLRRSAKVLLDGASVTLNPGEKVGLVGRNGAGKSTLFALLNGTLHEDGGDFAMPAQWRLAQVAQNMPETDESATDFVLGGDTRLAEAKTALAAAETSGDGMAIAHAHSDLADAGEHDAASRAQALILGLGFKTGELGQPVNSFSGGWRMRLQLARALMCPSDLLLLDEPTNHLDLDALVWLEAWLKRYPGTLIVISHDREFLDAITNVTLHLDNARLTRYGGNYSAFETLQAQQLALQQAAFARQQDKIAHLQKFIDRFKAKASKAKQAQSRVKALERMEKIAPVLANAEFTFEFKEPDNLPNPMLAITDASFGYRGDGEVKTILQGVNRTVLAGQRIGILGANGQGKSTLVKTIARTMGPLAGTVTEGKGLNIGYFAQQELDVLRPQDNPLEHMVRLAKELGANARESSREQDLRNYLGTFNFSGDMVKQSVGTMSGGEKARLVLAMIVWQRPNLLLLDEPTNHLDLATREALSMALNEFEGTVMLVSHDRALLRAVCDEFWLVGRGGVAPFDGDLDDYQRYLLEEAKRLREQAREAERTAAAPEVAAPVAAPDNAPRGAEQRRLDAQRRQQLAEKTRPLRRALEQTEQRMAALNAQRSELEQRLAAPQPANAIAEAGRELKAVNDELEALEEKWLHLSEQIEQATT
ncbi:ATP-binding cassette domain-containing protein [Ramlibacter sp. 2FC]|uniref:ABC-F family ATP-binding cassette domain-containing protein n=1 Tax=Ramlibacter sp. 2FC TaxID=2502188 RepID=UPI0010F6B7BC|nr:ATP-binding cassette domain-containing protein [Ramlibacter sp. 2FC]